MMVDLCGTAKQLAINISARCFKRRSFRIMLQLFYREISVGQASDKQLVLRNVLISALIL